MNQLIFSVIKNPSVNTFDSNETKWIKDYKPGFIQYSEKVNELAQIYRDVSFAS